MRPAAFPRSVLVVLIALLPAYAGCIDDAASTRFAATATTGHEFSSWDYGAATIQHMTADLAIEVDEEANTGSVVAEGGYGANGFRVELTEFTHSADDFHSGGIAANFDEHGDTGVGNDLLPTMHLLIATWGPGKVALNGMDFIDPYTGSAMMDAHLMVTDTGVRDDTSGKVLKSDGSTPYDPGAAGDATIGRDLEAHLVFTSKFLNDTPAPEALDWAGQFTPPAQQAVYPFDIKYSEAAVNISMDLGSEPYEAGPYRFSLVDADGNEVESVALQQPGLTMRTIEKAGLAAGAYTLRVTSDSVPAGDWDAQIGITYPPKPFFYFFWEDVTVGERVS